ncbi:MULTISPECIES: hypothetical protein [Bradyrhizobium]|uniref:Uncharacterized protein n=1 Tax=Bradyrhizobium elkanii TaxID=29448 RepID=A0A8I2C4C6_BRAEL|nr:MULTISPECIES: hypothetical protein [Bradyrhizobium]MCS4010898.1 hypothetical protein [Bradyrhizobium elkanii USDA 61]MBP1293783.1 hypothetical protein [Bradyrhizobium elkanii]MCP1925633.1 hypothetical protein [Bradyrhizobium elkanii]MCS3451270.1 hypothetical protein [Bradyrhizobium elkanii]MCS3476875.1 hypothetical protein [Bradyrhizobium elkanii]
MRHTFTSRFRRLTLLGWHDIASAPFGCVIELAMIDGERQPLGVPCIRHTEGWLDAATMQPVIVSATHWRHWQPDVLPTCCC